MTGYKLKRILFFLSLLLTIGFYFSISKTAISLGTFLNSFQLQPTELPFDFSRFFFLILRILKVTTLTTLWIIISLWIGLGILTLLKFDQESPEKFLLISIGLGFGALASGIYGLCLAKKCSILGIIFLIVTLSFFSRKKRITLIKSLINTWPKLNQPLFEKDLLFVGLMFCVTCLFLFHWIGLVVPPIAFDELNYQLTIPQLFILNKGYFSTPFNHLSFLPKNINMLFILGLLSGGSLSAKLISFFLSMLCTLTIFIFGRDLVGKKASFWAACFFFLTPVIANQFRLAVVDVGMSFFELIGLFLVIEWTQNQEKLKHLILASLFWGFAISSKYNAIPGFLISGGIIFLNLIHKKSFKKIPITILGFILPAFFLCVPWLLKNYIESGNPLTPLFSRLIQSRNFIFAGEYKPLVDYTGSAVGIPTYFPMKSIKDFIFLPWRMTVQHNDFNNDLGPIFFIGLVTLIFYPESLKKLPKTFYLILALYWTSFLIPNIRIVRYFTTGLALTSLLVGFVLNEFFENESRTTRTIFAISLLVVFLQQTMRIIQIQNEFKKPWGYIAGRISDNSYVNALLPDSPMPAFEFINNNTPTDAKILVVDEFRNFYLKRLFYASTPWDHDYWHEFVHISKNPSDLIEQLKAKGISYALFNETYLPNKIGMKKLQPWNEEDLKKNELFMSVCFEKVYTNETAWVGKLK